MTGGEFSLHSFAPKRIISLVPSQTELLADLGLDNEVAGITKFCVHPERWFRTKQKVGGTKTLDLRRIEALNPDLIIANKEENEQDQIRDLQDRYPVWISDIRNLEDALIMIREVGSLVGREPEAQRLAQELTTAFSMLGAGAPLRTAYLIWYKPWMAAASDTFIDSMLRQCGWQNVFADRSRYPEISPEDLVSAEPELLLLSSEPFPFKEKHAAELRVLLPRCRILLVDGEMFSWYGSRLLPAVAYLKELITTL